MSDLKGTNALAAMWAQDARESFDSIDWLAEAQRKHAESVFRAGVMVGISFALRSETLDAETRRRLSEVLDSDAHAQMAGLFAKRDEAERSVERPVLHTRRR